MSNLEQQVKELTAKVQELNETIDTMTQIQLYHSEALANTLAYLQKHKLDSART